MFDVFYIGRKPNLFPHEREVSDITQARKLSRTRFLWIVNYLSDYTDFDFLWEPVPWQATQTHVWPSQWHAYSGTYLVPRDIDKEQWNFHTEVIANRSCRDLWTTLEPIDEDQFDWSWSPHPLDPPYVYVFGNQWYRPEIMPTLEYRVPGATEVKYVDWPRAQIPQNKGHQWKQLADCDWDYSWVPDPGDPPYIYVFGNQWWPAEKMPTMEYHVPGATERKYMTGPIAKLPVDMTYWTIPDGVDVSDMDFSWIPDPGEPPYIYQFATQHQKTGGPQYRVEGATEVKYLDMMRAEVSTEAVPIIEIDHMDGAAGQIANVIKRVRYFDNYRDTLIRIAKSFEGEHEHVWICSSVCDYTDFDFSWHPEVWQSTMLHVFASDKEKFGDTFYMHVPTFAARAEQKALLEWYNVNFVPGISVPRRPMPVIKHDDDCHLEQVRAQTWLGPAAIFTNTDREFEQPTVNLWRSETKNIIPIGQGASVVVVPKVAVPHIKTQLYDYPNIDKKSQRWQPVDPLLDIVFISNGEPNADTHYEHLRQCLGAQQHRRLHRVDGVNGRAAAYHAAAAQSHTPWFFAVFAKLRVSEDFNWAWQPDRLQQSKHYIFHARNPVNGLEYGHQAMIAYNKKLTLANPGRGLDFTLDDAHEVVPIVSGTAYYCASAWMAWRTAFRECIKLRSATDVESQYRLSQWLKENNTDDLVRWSHIGAQDAVEYYDQVSGDFEELRKTYEWQWLASYAENRHNLTLDR